MPLQRLLIALFLLSNTLAYQTAVTLTSPTGIYTNYFHLDETIHPRNTQVYYTHTFTDPLDASPKAVVMVSSFFHQTSTSSFYFQVYANGLSQTSITFCAIVETYGTYVISLKLGILYCDQSLVGPIIQGEQFFDINNEDNFVSIGVNLENKTIFCTISYYDVGSNTMTSNQFGFNCFKNQSSSTVMNIRLDLQMYRVDYYYFIVQITWFIIDQTTLFPFVMDLNTLASHDWTQGASIPTSIYDPATDDQKKLLIYFTNFSYTDMVFSTQLSNDLTTIPITHYYNYVSYNYACLKLQHPIVFEEIQYQYGNKTFRIIVKNVIVSTPVNTSLFTITSTPALINLTNASRRSILFQDELELVFYFNSELNESASLQIQFNWIKGNRTYESVTDIGNVRNPFFVIEGQEEQEQEEEDEDEEENDGEGGGGGSQEEIDLESQCLSLQSNQTYISQSGSVSNISFYLQFVYFFLFATSLLNSKMIAVQLIFFLQLSFISLAPVTNNPYMKSLTSMKYVLGYNPLFHSLPQETIPPNFTQLGFLSNFLSNCNLTPATILVPILISSLLFLAQHYSSHYRTKPVLLKYAKSFMFQWTIVILLFNLPNIIMSLAINLKSLGSSDVLSLAVGFTLLLLPICVGVMYAFHKDKLREFNQQFHGVTCIPPLSVEMSRAIRKTYFIVALVEMYITFTTLAVVGLEPYSLYIVLSINTIFGGYYTYIQPYKDKSNNIRLIVQRSLLIAQTGTLIASQLLLSKAQQCSSNSTNFLFSYGYLAILSLALIPNATVIVFRLIDWAKSGTKIDQELFNEQVCKKEKPWKPSFNSEKTMKRSTFSIGKREIESLVQQTSRSKKDVIHMLKDIKENMLIVQSGESGYY